VPPIMVQSATNPGGLPIKVFDDIRAGLSTNRSQFFKDLAIPFFGYNRPGVKVVQGTVDWFWFMGMLGGYKGLYDCVKAFSETDFNEDLKKIDVPTLVLHGDDDQIVPIKDAGILTAKIVKNAKLKIIPGGPHGMCNTLPDEINAELLAFIRS